MILLIRDWINESILSILYTVIIIGCMIVPGLIVVPLYRRLTIFRRTIATTLWLALFLLLGLCSAPVMDTLQAGACSSAMHRECSVEEMDDWKNPE